MKRTHVINLAQKAAMALAIAAFSAATWGQVQQVPQGHVLDANPQVGSGGSNHPIPGYVPINGNAIITGNVAGLARFHGTVGSSSPYEFQQTLPSAAVTQNLARTSAAGIPTGPAGSPPPVYYLPSQLTSSAGGQIYSAQVGSGFEQRLIPASSVSPTYGGPRAGGQIYSPVATGTDEAGSLLNSPLFLQKQSFDSSRVEPGGRDTKSETNQRTGAPPGTQAPNDVNNSNTTETREDTTVSGRSRTEGRVPGQRIDNAAGTARNVTGQNPADPMDTRNTGPERGRTDLGQQAMVSDTYRTLMADLEKARAEAQRAQRTATSSGETPRTEEPRVAAGPGALPRTPGTTDPRAIRGRIPRMNPLLTEPPETLRAGQKVEPLKTLAKVQAGLPTTPFDTQMKQAEQLLKDGKYMEAIDQYQQALIIQPDNALGLVGRAHAELAAGMYQSAAMDLKAVFTQKPEMVSVRYAMNDFVPAKRVDNLMNDLMELTTRERSGNLASFLYCYLAYNTDHPNELQHELDRWAIRPTHDEWQAIAAKAWGK